MRRVAIRTIQRGAPGWLTLFSLTLAVVAVACGGSASDPPGPPPPPPPPAGWDDGIRLRPVVDRDPAPDVVEVDLEARLAPVEVQPGRFIEMWTYGGGVPGPLIRVPRGGRLIVHFTNQLPEETTIHWHGVRLPAAMDGVPGHSQSAVPPGGSFDYSFTVPDAGLFWYHPHVSSAAQVGDGLYGALLVEPRPDDSGAEHPADPADLGPELALVLSDVSVTDEGGLLEPDSGGDIGTLFGREGNLVLVNGRVGPTVLARPGQRQRWRLVNAARSRYFQLAMAGHAFTRIGGDGGLIPTAETSESLVLTPGERADVLVTPQGEPGTVVPVRWVPFDRGFGSTEFRPEVETFYVRLTEDTPITEAPAALPATLRAIAPLDLSNPAIQRAITLTQTYVDGKLVLGIDGVPSWDAEPLHARVGDSEVWYVTNVMDWDHPIHLHGFFFQVLDPDTGAPLTALGWKDTVNVPRQKTAAFAVRYDDRPGMWMFHCHILDHAEAGMMGMLHLAP
jgi:FtsP/CotA-like multicopper oxidase with cupredoxin domain